MLAIEADGLLDIVALSNPANILINDRLYSGRAYAYLVPL